MPEIYEGFAPPLSNIFALRAPTFQTHREYCPVLAGWRRVLLAGLPVEIFQFFSNLFPWCGVVIEDTSRRPGRRSSSGRDPRPPMAGPPHSG